MQLSLIKEREEEIQLIIQYWIRILKIKLGWIHNFDKLVVNYTSAIFMLITFHSSSKLLKTLTGHTDRINSIDYSSFDDNQLLCSGSDDKTVRVWDIENNKQIQSFNGHSSYVYCVKFSPYHYYNHHRNIICSSSYDICFWDFKNNQQLKLFKGHTGGINGIEFSSFSNGRYLCSGSADKTVRLWDIETSKSLHIFNGHEGCVLCVDISSLQSNNNNNNNNNNINVINVFVYGILKQPNNLLYLKDMKIM
ncbi:Serine/Threonine protein kinase [Reticulomyxa filosa]|uniref:Serine/Threonine protein kinase n=1 Tax=Reticulomyxa filosa TaxID=46433 RepID=X6NZ45_RETFI|nr:Serine/Threonine protein kinase [Reticulomyxa filosa]|eukprot:ETO31580.1 Serine/Threonine protein kinase [Reticulomyxa filosa]